MNKNQGLERWLSRSLVVLGRGLTFGFQHPLGSSVTLASGDLMPPSGVYGYCMYMICAHTSKLTKIKINKT